MSEPKKLADTEETVHGGQSKVERYGWARPDQPGELEWIAKEDLTVDHKYQRAANDAKCLQIAKTFNWPAFGVLIVARRGHKLLIVDGQHRWLGVRRRSDVSEVPCIVFESAGVVGEAQTFVDAQTLRKPVCAADKFKALLVSKDKIALGVQALFEGTGRRVDKFSSATTVSCVALLLKLQGTNPDVLAKVWPLVLRLCEGAPLTDRVLAAVVYVEAHLPDGISLTDEKWTKRLLKVGVEMVQRQIAVASGYMASGGVKAWATGLCDIINKGLTERGRLQLKTKTAPNG